MRVLFLVDMIDESTCGGAERFAAALAMELARRKVDMTLCATRYLSTEYQQKLAHSGVRTVALGRQKKWDVHRLWLLRGVLRQADTEILHAHKFGSNVWGSLIGRASRVPVVIAHEHTWAYEGDALRRLLDGRVVGRLADLFIAVSDDDARRMREYEGVPARKIRVLPTASVSGTDTPHRTSIRNDLGLSSSSRIVTVAAMMRPQKALDVLLSAFSSVVEQRPDTHLVLAGDGECRGNLERLTDELDLDHNVHFIGVCDNVQGLLAESDCAALSSDFEGMPLFVLESLAAGTRVVSTDVGAINTLIRNGQTGFLVPPRRPDELASAIIQVLDDPTDLESVQATCRSAVADLTVEAVATQFIELYEHALKAKGALSA